MLSKLLEELSNKETQSITVIAEKLGITVSCVRECLHHLVQLGYVKKSILSSKGGCGASCTSCSGCSSFEGDDVISFELVDRR